MKTLALADNQGIVELSERTENRSTDSFRQLAMDFCRIAAFWGFELCGLTE
jgi:hypothetical protein